MREAMRYLLRVPLFSERVEGTSRASRITSKFLTSLESGMVGSGSTKGRARLRFLFSFSFSIFTHTTSVISPLTLQPTCFAPSPAPLLPSTSPQPLPVSATSTPSPVSPYGELFSLLASTFRSFSQSSESKGVRKGGIECAVGSN